ncbi:hypothetical protein ABBQ38_015272 [Trebouxia sp. C0009 RCD-2024]
MNCKIKTRSVMLKTPEGSYHVDTQSDMTGLAALDSRHLLAINSVNILGKRRHLVSIALQKEANATLIMAKKKRILFPDSVVKRAVKQ